MDEGVRLIRSNIAVLEAANQVPNMMVKQLLDIFQTSSNKDFNQMFASWSVGMVVQGLDPTREEILDKALEVYSSLCDDKKWSKSRIKESGFTAFNKPDDDDYDEDDDKSASADSSDNEGETNSKQLEKREKNRLRRKKQKARKQVQAQVAAAAAGTTAAAAGPILQDGHGSDEIIRTFTMDRVEIRGNIKRPEPGTECQKRTFKRVDTGADIDLQWCWTCGNRGGMWKKHGTRDCPYLQRGREGSPSPSRERRVSFGPTGATAGMANAVGSCSNLVQRWSDVVGDADLIHPSEIREY